MHWVPCCETYRTMRYTLVVFVVDPLVALAIKLALASSAALTSVLVEWLVCTSPKTSRPLILREASSLEG